MDIKLMNYGRGAGKTYSLKQWALQNLSTRVLITKQPDIYRGTSIDRYRNVWAYDTDLPLFLQRLSREGTEVAFDDFDLTDPLHLRMLGNVQCSGVESVILATNLETLPTDASRDLNKKFGLGARVGAWKPSDDEPIPMPHGDKKIEGEVADQITKIAGDIGREYIKQHNARIDSAETLPGFKINKDGGLVVNGTIKLTDESEPIQSVRARDLRIGDYIVGKGHVSSIHNAGQVGYVVVEVAEQQETTMFEQFRGTFPHLRGDKLINVDTTKRK
jgi:hypothetical protein